MPQSFAAFYCHLIFSTKNHEPLILPDWESRLYEYIGGIIRGQNSVLLSAGGTADHTHLLLSLSRNHSISVMAREIKSHSSAWIHETFPTLRGFAWQAGYGAFSVSHSRLNDIKRYIANQREHHRVRSFQEEFIAFLKRHNIPYDEKTLWA